MTKAINFESLVGVPADLIEINGLISQKKAEAVHRQFSFANNRTVLIIDVKLPRFKDEHLYKDPNLRVLVPRGLCFVFIDNIYVYTLYGHPKFGYYGDYIENVNVDQTVKIFRSKENGECAHVGLFEYDEQIYVICGSKNVHIVFRVDKFDEDMCMYTEDRYNYAMKIAQLVNSSILQPKLMIYSVTKVFPKIIEYLLSTKYTLCAEACFIDSQHLVKYDHDDLYFFAITGKRETDSDPLVKVSPIEADELFESFNINKIRESRLCNTETSQKECEQYFEMLENSEGAVVNCVDSSGNVVYVYKHKNYDYVFMRALREQMRNMAPSSRIIKRLSTLHIVHPNYNRMVEYALQLNAFFRQEIKTPDQKTFFDMFISWQDVFKSIPDEKKQEILNRHNEYEKCEGTLDVIMFVAIPGAGKSFVGRVLKYILEKEGKKVCHLEQDMFSGSGKNASKEYDKAIGIAMNNKVYDCLILTKSNHSIQVRNKTYDTLAKCTRNINKTYIVMMHDHDIIKTCNICVQRILNRGLSHATLFGRSENEIRGILTSVFVEQWEELGDDELTNNTINLEIDQPRDQVIKSMCEQAGMLGIGNFTVSDEELTEIYQKIDREDQTIAKRNMK